MWFVVPHVRCARGRTERGTVNDECQELVDCRAARDCRARGGANHREPATCGFTSGDRGRVAVTTDGDAGLWWLPVADTNGKKTLARLGSAQLVQHAAGPDERRQLHGERVVRLGRPARHLRRVGFHPARRPRQPAALQHRSGTRRRRSARAVCERTLDRQQDRRPARRREVRVPERRGRQSAWASPRASASTCRPAMPTRARGQGGVAADVSRRPQQVAQPQGRADRRARLQLPQEPGGSRRRARARTSCVGAPASASRRTTAG